MNQINSGRRTGDRRSGLERRKNQTGKQVTEHRMSWEDQRTQYWTRLLFCGLALLYFNFGGEEQVRDWTNLQVVNLIFLVFGIEILFFMRHASRVPHAPWRQRLTMWIDIVMASFAVLADTTISSPGFLVYLMVILGNGMRYGLRLFGEAVIGSLGAVILIVSLRLFDYVDLFSVSAVFFLVFFAIIVIYSYTLTAKIELGRAKLAHERNIDALTGLLNRRALVERSSSLFQSQEDGNSVVVLFADLDGFKRVNDTHGHHVGDRLLAGVADSIANTVRDEDLVSRYGGDEFLLLLPYATKQCGETVAQRVRKAIDDYAKENGIDFSISIGMGRYPDHGHDLDSVIRSVDQAMYRSKLKHGGGGILHVDGGELDTAESTG
ncbi:MAG: GGDEF domain-containing protein [Candidatus Thiodiazotropha taylori]|nr:GGDEF domain-containing protein [Candidatus Thiodiazotropha sp. (ex Lucina pensylvanica)]MCG7878839.1 GGDEF domain-containing protein [Candidatus Thiodiazotropha taylori]MCW4225100.1 GGDEF domain-containing protein [Candidatus Thiodiazotropha endolucinida]MCG7883948.1 GGDEF domain-containing protein [Candidatus Thiodiazotropha taylori]MCG7886671.1 GGDEF domain-containing protein [Candidatus Thiodiazotropha taylori]